MKKNSSSNSGRESKLCSEYVYRIAQNNNNNNNKTEEDTSRLLMQRILFVFIYFLYDANNAMKLRRGFSQQWLENWLRQVSVLEKIPVRITHHGWQ